MASISGILIIDKPAGWTSHDVVAKLRGFTRQKRIGHGGTLDPMATGVLPIFIGRATRAAEFCGNAAKEYIAGLSFGIVTDTQDITGNVLSENAVSVAAGDLRAVLPSFLGRQKQVPPMYSAIKRNGKKLYELARRGEEVERPARDIEITAIEVVDESSLPVIAGSEDCGCRRAKQSMPSDMYLRISCSKGTYIRTLCHDIGQSLGCGAALSYLRRTKAGVFTLDMAHSLEDVLAMEDMLAAASGYVLTVDSIFSEYPAISLNENDTRKAKNGALCRLQCAADGKYRVYAPGGDFLSLAEIKSSEYRTIKNFFEA